MFKLNQISNDVLDWYYSKIQPKIITDSLSDLSKQFLDKDIIKGLLTGKPEILLDIHRASPCELKDKNVVEKIFDYEKFISKNKPTSYAISKEIGINTCIYCNRNYTLTIVHLDENTNQENDSTRISRPQFDHWFSQKDYPLLALSIYNLIPTCSICNSTIKGSKPLDLVHHIHPHKIENDYNEQKFSFSYDFESFSNLKVKINCKADSKIDKTLDFFKIKEVYDAHSNFELRDLYDLRNKYSKNYLDILLNKTFKNLSMSKEEIYRIVFGIEIKKEDYHKRPFSKFKHDIIEELLKIE